MNILWFDVGIWALSLVTIGVVFTLILKDYDKTAGVISIIFACIILGLFPAQFKVESSSQSFEVFKDYDDEVLPEKVTHEKQNFSDKMQNDIQEIRKQNTQ